MNGSRLASLASLALALGAGASAAANELGVAAIIGNKAYRDDRVPAVSYAHNDADAFYEFVVGTLGFSPDNVVDLRDATKVDMESAFGVRGNVRGQLWRWAEADGGSDIVVFYSGHGVPGISDRRGYLLPVDANLDMAAVNGYPIDVLYENLGKIPSKSVTVYLDACFSGGSGDGGVLVRNASPVSMAADVSGVKGMTVLTAASGEQLASWDTEARHGLFTEHLLDGLYGSADADGDGRVTAGEAKRHLDRTMTRAARRAYGREQDAVLHGDESVVLSFAPPGGWVSRPLAGPHLATFTVLAEPAEARIQILNTGEQYRAGMDLAAGSYDIEASAPGYVTKTATVAHGPSATVHRMVLSRSEGYETATETVSHGSEPTVRQLPLRRAGPKARESFRDCPECPEMVVVPRGSYRMGSANGESAEQPVHKVTISAPFALGKYEVTFAQWDACVRGGGCRTGFGQGPPVTYVAECRPACEYIPEQREGSAGKRPVIRVRWKDAQRYVQWLSEKTGEKYRLPSESEWEYAARAGAETAYNWGDEIGRNRANCNGCGNRWDHSETAPVGSFEANGWGLHDMHGNVWEWTEDCWNRGYEGAPRDGSAWLAGSCSRRVLRGGSWDVAPSLLRAATRGSGSSTGIQSNSSYGFRVARTLTP